VLSRTLPLCLSGLQIVRGPIWPSSFNKLIFGKSTHIHYVSYVLEEILVQLRSWDRRLNNRNEQLKYSTVLIFPSICFYTSIRLTYFLLGLNCSKDDSITVPLKKYLFLHEKGWPNRKKRLCNLYFNTYICLWKFKNLQTK